MCCDRWYKYLFNGVVGDEAEHYYLFLLTDTVNSVLCLQIHLRVPVGVKDDDSVCSLQIQAQSACSGTQQEDVVLTIRLIEQFHPFLPIFSFSATI